jgi:hypothetical protein
MAKNLPHCETGFGVYRSAQLTPPPLFFVFVRCPNYNLSNVARLAAHPKFEWVFNANWDGTIIYNNPV